MFNDGFIATLLPSLRVNNFWISINIFGEVADTGLVHFDWQFSFLISTSTRLRCEDLQITLASGRNMLCWNKMHVGLLHATAHEEFPAQTGGGRRRVGRVKATIIRGRCTTMPIAGRRTPSEAPCLFQCLLRISRSSRTTERRDRLVYSHLFSPTATTVWENLFRMRAFKVLARLQTCFACNANYCVLL